MHRRNFGVPELGRVYVPSLLLATAPAPKASVLKRLRHWFARKADRHIRGSATASAEARFKVIHGGKA